MGQLLKKKKMEKQLLLMKKDIDIDKLKRGGYKLSELI